MKRMKTLIKNILLAVPVILSASIGWKKTRKHLFLPLPSIKRWKILTEL